MANPTTNFGWVMPTSTSLVTNLPADFNTFGQAVDTSMAYLKGGTTGQILSKTSATDMAFTWITNDTGDITGVTAGTGISGGGTTGTVTVTNSMATAITTAGDLIKGTGSGTFDRLGIGSTGQVLTVASGVPSWATPSGGGLVLLASNTFSAVSSFSLPTSTFTTTYRNYRLVVNIDTVASSPSGIFMRFRASGTDNTDASWYGQRFNVPYSGATSLQYSTSGGTSLQISDSYDKSLTIFDIGNPMVTSRKTVNYTQGQGELVQTGIGGGYFLTTSNFDSVSLFMTAGTMTGRYTVYGCGQ